MKTISLKAKSIDYHHSISKVILMTLLYLLTVSCSNDDNEPPVKEEEPAVAITEISQDIKDLIYFKGDEKAAAVLITVPGGPSTAFATDLVDDFSPLLVPKGILTVTVHQAQTLDSTIVKGNDITLDQAIGFNTQSIAALGKVTAYFKNQGRTVYILGFSFGAFVAQDLIAKKGIDSADRYLIVSGRLDMNAIIWQGAAEGKGGFFENGVTPIIAAEPNPSVKERNLNRIGAGFLMNRYTQLLNTVPDLSDLTYIYGEMDQAVGRLTDDEIQFLRSKNAQILAGPGDHDTTFGEFIVQGFKAAFGIEIVL